MNINFLGTTLKVETKVVRRKWETVIRGGITAERLREFLQSVPDKAMIETIEEHSKDASRTVITFIEETEAQQRIERQ